MDIWTMIVLIVAISVISDMVKSKNNHADEPIKSDESISQHIGPLEDRVANLETIILEKERVDRFAELEKE